MTTREKIVAASLFLLSMACIFNSLAIMRLNHLVK